MKRLLKSIALAEISGTERPESIAYGNRIVNPKIVKTCTRLQLAEPCALVNTHAIIRYTVPDVSRTRGNCRIWIAFDSNTLEVLAYAAARLRKRARSDGTWLQSTRNGSQFIGARPSSGVLPQADHVILLLPFPHHEQHAVNRLIPR